MDGDRSDDEALRWRGGGEVRRGRWDGEWIWKGFSACTGPWGSPLSAYLIYCSAWPLLNLIVFTIVVRFKNRGCFMYFGLFWYDGCLAPISVIEAHEYHKNNEVMSLEGERRLNRLGLSFNRELRGSYKVCFKDHGALKPSIDIAQAPLSQPHLTARSSFSTD